MENEAIGTYFEEEKRPYKFSRARKASLKGQRECTVGHAQWHNHVGNLVVQPNFLKLYMTTTAEVHSHVWGA